MKTISIQGFVAVISLVLLRYVTGGAENDTEMPDDSFDNDIYTGNNKHNELMFHLSINQTEEGLRKLLVKIDVNNDDIITRDELTEWLIKSNDAIEEKEASEYINQYDHDNDSMVSWDEYVQHFYGSPTLDFAKTNQDHKEILDFVEGDRFRFKSADTNKDGLLSLQEMKAFLHPHNHVEMSDYEGVKILKDYDMNNDSMISKEEFAHVQYGGITINPSQKTRINRIFESYDINKDDRMSLDEVKLWLKPDVAEFARTEALHLMKVSDVNKDLKVTKDEILQSFDHWMSSKATNYGDHVRDEL